MSEAKQVKKLNSPYIRFTKVHFKITKEENPNLSFGEISRLLGSKWKTLPADEKQVFIDEYEKEVKKLRKTIQKTKHKKAKSKKSKTKSKKHKRQEVFSSIGNDAIAMPNMDNYYTDLQNVAEWHTSPSSVVQGEQPWPANMYPHLYQPNFMNPLQMPAAYPVSSPLPLYLQHSGNVIGAVNGSTAFPNHDPNLLVDSNGNISSSFAASSGLMPIPTSVAVPSGITPIPTGIYTSEYYDEIVSKTGVSEVEQEDSSNSPSNVSDVIEID